jgi:hypothetical protein
MPEAAVFQNHPNLPMIRRIWNIFDESQSEFETVHVCWSSSEILAQLVQYAVLPSSLLLSARQHQLD